MVVTSVRDSRYEVSIANTTARASGVNRKRPTPVSRTTGKKTMQIQRVPTRVGAAIWLAPSRIAISSGLFDRLVAMDVLDFHGRVVNQHPNRESDSAQRHRVDGLAAQLEPDDRSED